ncbi:anti-repressor SinI family protein [Gracilibacillus massiliensis]|uniref:anti-repressor SinI family protein n=1 Tax=Gracilibacillus massiliensis TaxID=1564956 RepID=UPI00071C9E26|nr:anti-repressor SinI family protein [Gracilibacillus massiliensis]
MSAYHDHPKQLDAEWLRLIYIAEQQGLTKEEVQSFLKRLPVVNQIKNGNSGFHQKDRVR